MIKKYGSKILTTVSFTGIAISNVKATNKQKVHIRIGNIVFYKAGDATIDIKGVKSLEELFNLISSLGEIKKNGDVEAVKVDFSNSHEKYFVKEVKVGNDADNKLSDDLKIDISSAKADVEITLVSKRKCIEFKYTKNGKQLIRAAEDNLLKTVIQGGALSSIDCTDILSNRSSKLGGKAISGTDIIGKTGLILNENNKLEFEIVSSEICTNVFKKFVCNFAEDVKSSLVTGLHLYKFDGLAATDIISDNKGKTALGKLNEIQVGNTGADVSFFKGKFEILKDGSDTEKVDTENETAKTNFNNGSFYVLKDIKKENINAKYLKKTFEVKLDSTDTTKSVLLEKNTELINALNRKFGNSVELSTKEIWDFLKTKNKIINATFNSNIKINKGAADISKAVTDGDNLVDDQTTKFVIKLPEGAFNNTVVKTEIKLTCILDDVKKDDKKLTNDVKNLISGVLSEPLTKVTSITDFIAKLNAALKGKFENDSKQIEAVDIDFDKVKDGANITKHGAITITETFAKKLKDDCFVAKPSGGNPPKNDENNNGQGGSGDNKKSKKCACYKK